MTTRTSQEAQTQLRRPCPPPAERWVLPPCRVCPLPPRKMKTQSSPTSQHWERQRSSEVREQALPNRKEVSEAPTPLQDAAQTPLAGYVSPGIRVRTAPSAKLLPASLRVLQALPLARLSSEGGQMPEARSPSLTGRAAGEWAMPASRGRSQAKAANVPAGGGRTCSGTRRGQNRLTTENPPRSCQEPPCCGTTRTGAPLCAT